MVVAVQIRIRDKSDAIKVEGKAYTTEAPAGSAQTAGGVHTLVIDFDDPEGWLNAPVEELERWEAEQGFDKADDL